MHPDDEIARLIDSRASAQIYEAALKRAAAAGDDICVRVITVYAALIAEGEPATDVAVGQKVQKSGPGVAAIKARFGRYLAEVLD